MKVWKEGIRFISSRLRNEVIEFSNGLAVAIFDRFSFNFVHTLIYDYSDLGLVRWPK